MGDANPTFLDLLRAELSNAMKDLELRLVDRYAAKKDVEAEFAVRDAAASAQAEALDKRFEAQDAKIDGVVAWRNKMAGGLVLASIMTPVLTTIAIHLWR